MAVIVSTINLKGGVGKTSTTVALAEFLVLQHHKKVLVIDLDPQTNATAALIGETRWLDKDRKGETLLQLFRDELDDTKKFDVNKAVERRVSNIAGGAHGLDLLPSSLGLIEIQDDLAKVGAGRFHIRSPVMILKDAVADIVANYDFVLVDCPPNLGIITLNGILLSRWYLIPCIPDILSTWGIPQIVNRISKFRVEAHTAIEPVGIVTTMFRSATNLHSSTLAELRARAAKPPTDSKWVPRVFDTVIGLATKAAEASDYDAKPNTVKQKYGYGNAYSDYESLAKEFLKYV